MKKIIVFLSFQLIYLGYSFANETCYKIDDQKIDSLFVASEKITSLTFTESLFLDTISENKKSQILAGVLAISLGYLGVHRFYLGHYQAGILDLGGTLATIASIVLFHISPNNLDALLFIGIPASVAFCLAQHVILDGILYLCVSKKTFDTNYRNNKAFIPW